MYRAPVGPAGRGPQRVWRVTDLDNWGHAVCGRMLAEYERGAAADGKERPAPEEDGGPATADEG